MTEKNDSGKNQTDANIISKFDKKQEYLHSLKESFHIKNENGNYTGQTWQTPPS